MSETAAAAKALGDWMQRQRRAAKLTQKQVAMACGWSDERNIKRWEAGDAEPGASSFLLYLDAIGGRIVPGSPGHIPRAVNVELRLMRLAMEHAMRDTLTVKERAAYREDLDRERTALDRVRDAEFEAESA